MAPWKRGWTFGHEARPRRPAILPGALCELAAVDRQRVLDRAQRPNSRRFLGLVPVSLSKPGGALDTRPVDGPCGGVAADAAGAPALAERAADGAPLPICRRPDVPSPKALRRVSSM